MTEQQLKQQLEGLPLQEVSVRVEGRPGHLLAEVVSPSFEGVDDVDRQQQVWAHLLSSFSAEECVEVEFVFTYTPAEIEADPSVER